MLSTYFLGIIVSITIYLYANYINKDFIFMQILRNIIFLNKMSSKRVQNSGAYNRKLAKTKQDKFNDIIKKTNRVDEMFNKLIDTSKNSK